MCALKGPGTPAASQSFGLLLCKHSSGPGAKECIFAFSVCVHVYITMYICLVGCHEVYMPSAGVVTLALWEQMEEQRGVWNEKL